MTKKRAIDLALALILALPVAVALGFLWLVVVPLQGRPFIYTSERMRRPDQPFQMYKIRTMRPVSGDGAQGVLGLHAERRVTPIGRFLRSSRLDELPQLWNVLLGDMSFVGPRPPLRRYVEAYPDLYDDILQERPGITGLATVLLHNRERRILSGCLTEAETDAVYRSHCIPLKARLDRLYSDRKGLRLDAYILYLTIARLARSPRLARSVDGARARARAARPAVPSHAKSGRVQATLRMRPWASPLRLGATGVRRVQPPPLEIAAQVAAGREGGAGL